MENPQTTEGLAAAVRAIQDMAAEAHRTQLVEMKCDDGKGGVVMLPVPLLEDKEGAIRPIPLIDIWNGAVNMARAWRLQNADGPDRREGAAQHQSLESFIAHANRFKAANSAVWADPTKRALVSVLDYHEPKCEGRPRWGKHRGVYPCPLSEAWQAWGGEKGLALGQDAFAALLDSRDRELTSGALPGGGKAPEPSALVTLAANLEVYSTATAKRVREPNTGKVKVAFSEESGFLGEVVPPPAFLVRIPIFQDSEPQELEVRLRVDVVSNHAQFSVRIHAAGEVLRQAFGEICLRVAEATGMPVFHGTPE